MSFKVWDKVRLTRKALHNKCASPTRNEVFGGEVNNIDKDWYYTVIWFEDDYLEQSLELVPEEPEFEFWEEIEVKHTEKEEYTKRYFIAKISIWDIDWYLCYATKTIYLKHFDVQLWAYARKLKPKLSRKEIAEKFKISEDFILVD